MKPSRGGQVQPRSTSSTSVPQELDTEVALQQRKCTDILKQARRDANQAIAVGEDTSIQLAKQGEQMSNIDRKLDETEYELKVSDRLVKSIGSWGGAFVSWMLPKPKAPPTATGSSSSPAPTTEPASAARPSSSKPSTAASSSGSVSRPDKKQPAGQKQQQVEQEARSPFGLSKEEEDLLDGLGQDVSTLKHHATLHRTVLEEQNRQLDRMNAKADKVQDHLHKTNRNVKNLL